MLIQYKVKVNLEGHYVIEDPKCPSSWKGSGVYDRQIDCWCDLDIEVWAHSLAEAVKFAEDYNYDDPATVVDIESAKRVKALPDRDEEEAGVIEHTVVYNWKEEYGSQI